MNIKLKNRLILVFAAFVVLSSHAVIRANWEGAGTQANPFQIKNRQDLVALADSVNNGDNWSRNKYFIVMNDIADSVRMGIGASFGYGMFQGDFNGNNKKITLAITTSGAGGLFRYMLNARVYDLSVDGYVRSSSGDFVGGVCGLAINSTILNCTNYVNITGRGYIAGICGYLQNNSIIAYCINNGNIISNAVSSDDNPVGGISGCLSHSKILHSSNSGFVSGRYGVGGITGHSHTRTEISHCINIGVVVADSLVGGISGGYDNMFQPDNGDISYSINAGLIIGRRAVGGIIGQSLGIIKNCINTGVISSSVNNPTFMGAIVGRLEGGVVENCHYDKQMCVYGGINNNDVAGQAEGHLTREGMIGTGLQSKLGNAEWFYPSSDTLYPMLKSLQNEIISKVAASPAYLVINDADYSDRQNNVRNCFYVSLEDNVQWTNMLNRVAISGSSISLMNLGNDTLIAGIGIYKKVIPIVINNVASCCSETDFIQASAIPFDSEKQLRKDYSFTLGAGKPKLRIKFYSDAPISSLNEVKEFTVSFDFCNLFCHIRPETLRLIDLGNNWTIKESKLTQNIAPLTSNYSVTISSNSSSGLFFIDSISVFEVDMMFALPYSGQVEKVLPEHYVLDIIPKLTITATECLSVKDDTTHLKINPICAVDTRILKLSDIEFGIIIEDNVVNYSIGFDCEATLTIYNSLGQSVLIPMSGHISKGHYTLNISNINLPSGTYFCELLVNNTYRKIVAIYVLR